MRKRYVKNLLTAILAGTMMFTGVPYITEPITVVAEATSKLPAPTGFKAASAKGNSIKLTWNKVSGADGYRVYMYSSKSDEYEVYKNISGTTCNVKDLKAATTYKFKIAALVKSGKSYSVQTKSNSISVQTVSGSKLSEFKEPQFGIGIKKAISDTGIKNYKKNDTPPTNGEVEYDGDILFKGKKARLYLMFNNNEKLYKYQIKIFDLDDKEASSMLKILFNETKKKFGNDYVSKYPDDNGQPTEYVWENDGIDLYRLLSVSYSRENVNKSNLKEFNFPTHSQSFKEAMNSSGLTEYIEYTDLVEKGVTTYKGSVLFNGKKTALNIEFKGNTLYRWNLNVELSRPEFNSLITKCRRIYGNSYSNWSWDPDFYSWDTTNFKLYVSLNNKGSCSIMYSTD